MILLIDIGNSCIKYAVLNGNELESGSRSDYADDALSNEWCAELTQSPDAIYLVSVASKAINDSLIDMCFEQWGIVPVRLVTTHECAGVVNGYVTPETLGVDRWAAMVGAYQLIDGAVLVIDCGTACSADLIDSDGRHQGGAITPGVRMMQQSLYSGTARINRSAIKGDTTALGISTSGCIHLGINLAVSGFIERMHKKSVDLVGDRVTVIMTGGDAPSLLAHLNIDVRYEKELVFLGMVGIVAGMEA